MKILVTGGAGFIGSNFARYVLDKHKDDEVVVLDKLTYSGHLENLEGLEKHPRFQFIHGDILNPMAVEGSMKGCQAVVNFAAETHVDRSILDAGAFVDTDVRGTYQLLEIARRIEIERFVQVSTDEVYGEAQGRPSKEGDDLKPKSPYAASKAGADRMAYSYFETFGVPVTISRCSNNLGPYQFPEKLIPLFCSLAEKNQPLPVYGDGKNTRDWIWVADHCRALDQLLRADGVVGEVFNIGSGEEKSVLEVCEGILERMGKPKDLIRRVKDRPGHVRRHAVDTGKAQRVIGFVAELKFDEALDKTVSWYKEHSEWIEKVTSKTQDYKEYMDKNYGGRK